MDLREDQIPEENTELFPQVQEEARKVQEEEPVDEIADVEDAELTETEEPAQCETEAAETQPDNTYSQEIPWSAPAFQQPLQADNPAAQQPRQSA